MNIEQYAIDVMVKKLEECEKLISDEAYDFIMTYEGGMAVDDIWIYLAALVDYLDIIDDRYYMEDADEEDAEIIKKMILLIHALTNAMLDDEDDVIIIEP